MDQSSFVALWRGLSKRCPRCGEGAIFARWYTIHESCPSCGLDLVSSQSNTWAFMYISTAAMTGAIVLAMLVFQPPHKGLARVLVFFAALLVILMSLPYRKGLAIAMEYLIDRRWGSATEQSAHPKPPNDPS